MVKYTYKDTGIEWLGKIPEHWIFTRIKKEFKVIPSNVDKKSFDTETDVKLCNYVDVYYNDFLDTTVDYMVATANDGEIKKFKLQVNDVIITKDSEDPFDIAVPALITEIQDNFLCGYHLSMIRSINEKIDGKFLFWSLKDEAIASQLFREATGVTRWAIASRHIKDSTISFPPLPEQKAIANYLDKACERIDKIIEIKQKQLEKIEDLRISKYQEIITTGLNKNTEFINSKINSLGKYPVHWKLLKLKLITDRIGDGIHSTPEYTEGEKYFFINGNNLVDGKIEIKDSTRTVSKAEYLKHYLNLKKNTLLLSINGTIGNLAFYNYEGVVFGKSAAFIEVLERLNKRFLYYFMQSYYIKDLIELSLEGTTIRNLSLNTIRNLKVLLPPKEEQNEIVKYLDLYTEKLFKIREKTTTQITTLKSYRKSLIHECVTGKKQVWDGDIENVN